MSAGMAIGYMGWMSMGVSRCRISSGVVRCARSLDRSGPVVSVHRHRCGWVLVRVTCWRVRGILYGVVLLTTRPARFARSGKAGAG